MVYRGKPSAGCENCRKAKKRCGLEQPACSRCVKLKKTCGGYRDTTQLMIQDESEVVKFKAERQKAKPTPKPQTQTQTQFLKPTIIETPAGIPTPGSTSSGSTDSSDTIELDAEDMQIDRFTPFELSGDDFDLPILDVSWYLKPKPDDVATNYYFDQFTSSSHWQFMRGFASHRSLDPCLELAVKAVGMAALSNVQGLTTGKDFARAKYVEALSYLNESLRDPKRCKTDESLIAVAMLGYYENLTCDGRESIQSWKAHVSGAAQLLKLRGKSQFKTQIGRILYRETRAQILINAIWEDQEPPAFLWDLQPELAKHSDDPMVPPQDDLNFICFDFAVLRAKLRRRAIDDDIAADQANELERRYINWEVDTLSRYQEWRYNLMEVPESEHIWNGKVHSYAPHYLAPTPWNTYRSMRLMLSRTQEMLFRRLEHSDSELEQQIQYHRKLRRKMTDDICTSVPVALGNASPAYSSPCVLITAYGAIWPLFFAGTVTLERCGPGAWSILNGEPATHGAASSAAAAQASWIMGQLEYISKVVGLKWADGVVAILMGDFKILKDVDQINSELDTAQETRAPWMKVVEEAKRGPRYLIETPSLLSDKLAEENAANYKDAPIWLGREAGAATYVENAAQDKLRNFGNRGQEKLRNFGT